MFNLPFLQFSLCKFGIFEQIIQNFGLQLWVVFTHFVAPWSLPRESHSFPVWILITWNFLTRNGGLGMRFKNFKKFYLFKYP